MKKITLTSLLTVLAVSAANAAPNYFVGGSANLGLNDNHTTVFGVAPEFGWKYNADWDLGVAANFGYDHKYATDVQKYDYGADLFARYKLAQFGATKLLLKGSVGADFITYHNDALDENETETRINAAIIPMVTYDVSESLTLYANLNFLGVYAGYTFENKDLGIDEGWRLGAFANSANVANTGDFQIGFNYNF